MTSKMFLATKTVCSCLDKLSQDDEGLALALSEVKITLQSVPAIHSTCKEYYLLNIHVFGPIEKLDHA